MGNLEFGIYNELYDKILSQFFIGKNNWYVLGVSMTKLIVGGFGEVISSEYGLSPRYGSDIDAIMYN